MKRRLRRVVPFLALGLATTLAVALLLAAFSDAGDGVATQAQAWVDDELWSVTRYDRAGAMMIHSVRTRGLNWSPGQATGPPNTLSLGDQVTAWASQTADGQAEWLALEYDRAVIPRRVDVYESLSPGALTKVTVFDAAGKEIEAWSGTDPTPKTSSTVTATPIPVKLDVLTKKVKLYLASDKVSGWNEIDAVGLVDDRGEVQWARRAEASSTYASVSPGTRTTTGSPESLVPAWTGLRSSGSPVGREECRVEARGWPLLALWTASDGNARGSAAGAGGPFGQGPMSSTIQIGAPAPGRLRSIPLRPVWVGLVGGTIFYAAIWGILWVVLIIPRRFIGEVARVRRGACVRCGYDLGYDFVRGCPECGWRRDGGTGQSGGGA